MMTNEHQIFQSWQQNAEAWTHAVRQEQIESRTLVTNQAIVDAVTSGRPCSVLDLGCGEGWLARTLAAKNLQVLGVDAISALIEQARKADRNATYRVSSYDDIVGGSLDGNAPFDAVVCNFSLFGKESIEELVSYVPHLLSRTGRFIIQTLHPLMAHNDQPYQDGWRAGSWQGFDPKFTNPAPWYFRTLEGWVQLMNDSQLDIETILEPIHPRTRQPASIIFVSNHAASSQH